MLGKRGKREDVRVPGMSVFRSAAEFDTVVEEEAPMSETSACATHGGDEVGHGPLYQIAEGLSDGTPTAGCLVVSVVDQTNQEAVCTALIIKDVAHPPISL